MQAMITAFAVAGGVLVGLLFALWRFFKRTEVPMTRGDMIELREIVMRSQQRSREEVEWRT